MANQLVPATESLSPVPATEEPPARAEIHVSRTYRLFRTAYVSWVLFRFLLTVFLEHRGWLHRGLPEELRKRRLRRQAERLRDRFVALGPTFIKIGQALATRADLLPLAFIDELAKLQNRVPAFPNEQAFAIIERELGKPPRELFARFNLEPIAAASLGQVYRARLRDGSEVVVKVQRPNIEDKIALDLDILRRIGRFLARYPQFFKGQDWLGMIDEFDRVIHEELDYRAEGRNAERFKANFAEWRDVHVPKIHWQYSTSRVLTMEFLNGVRVNDKRGLSSAGVNSRKVNELMHRTYFKQLLEDGFFHADPHPGNILILRDGRLGFFDFGMVGRITPQLQGRMVSAFFHILERDCDGIVQDLIGLDFLKPEVNVPEFSAIVADMFRRKIDVKLSEVRFKDLTYELGEIIYKYPVSTPSSFTFIVRALMTLEGISIQMNPDFNFLEVAKPYAADFLFRRDGARMRQTVWETLHDARTGRLDWGRVFSLARTAVSQYFNRER